MKRILAGMCAALAIVTTVGARSHAQGVDSFSPSDVQPTETRAVGVFPDHSAFFYKQMGGDPLDEATAKLLQADGELGEKVARLAATFKEIMNEDQRDQAEAELEKLVNEQFAVKQKLRAEQLARLESQVKRLRNLHDERQEQRERIVADRVQQILREAQGLGWGDAGSDVQRNEFKLWYGGAAAPKIKRVERKLQTWSDDEVPAKIVDEFTTRDDSESESRGSSDSEPRERRSAESR